MGGKPLNYFTYRRFKGKGIDGAFNLKYGTIITENGGFLYTQDGRCICAVTSENGWQHFRTDTPEGEQRQAMIDRLYRYYESGQGDSGEDFAPEKWPGAVNLYWKNLIRTMRTPQLEEFYKERLGEPPICT